MSGYFYGKQIPYNYGDSVATAISNDGTTLKLTPPEGYYSGTDKVTATDADFVAGNILETAEIFGVSGSIPVKSDSVASSISNDGTKLEFVVPVGYYDGTKKVTHTDANFLATNIKDGVSMFGVTGTLVGGDYQLLKTGQTTSLIENDDGDLERGLVVATRYTDNEDNTITDNATGFRWINNPIIVCNEQTLLSAEGAWSEASVSYEAGDVVQYPPTVGGWSEGQTYTVGTKVAFEMEGGVYRCIQEHTSDWAVTIPAYGSDWASYWVLDNYPTATAWANSTPYTVGNEVSVSEMVVTEVYICIQAHTSSWETMPGPMGGGTSYPYWATKNNKYVCISNHTFEIAKAPTNATYWVEAPFTGSAANLTTERTMSWYTLMYQVNKLTYLAESGESWVVPNINELLSIVNYGKAVTRDDLFTNISANVYWSSTKSEFTSYGEVNLLAMNFNTGATELQADYAALRPIFHLIS